MSLKNQIINIVHKFKYRQIRICIVIVLRYNTQDYNLKSALLAHSTFYFNASYFYTKAFQQYVKYVTRAKISEDWCLNVCPDGNSGLLSLQLQRRLLHSLICSPWSKRTSAMPNPNCLGPSDLKLIVTCSVTLRWMLLEGTGGFDQYLLQCWFMLNSSCGSCHVDFTRSWYTWLCVWCGWPTCLCNWSSIWINIDQDTGLCKDMAWRFWR